MLQVEYLIKEWWAISSFIDSEDKRPFPKALLEHAAYQSLPVSC